MKLFFLFSLIFMSFSLFASEIEISNAFIKALPPGTSVTSITFDLKNNTKKDIILKSVNGTFADAFEIHTMSMKNSTMQMKKVDQIVLKKQSTTELKSGGYHIMVFDPKSNIVDEKEYSLTLHFEKRKDLVIKIIGKKPFEDTNHEHH